jgi:large subunit ribosomal protein L27
MVHAVNGRDSNPKNLGVKAYQDQKVTAGSIIVRQRGTRFVAGKNTFLGKDYTIHAKIDGKVLFRNISKTRQCIDVIPA